jgi:two-component system response regulator QseB
MRVLLVEDNELLGSGLRLGLIQHDFTVDWVKDGKAALQALLSQNEEDHFDAVILDLGLPKLSGLDILKSIRAKNIKTPILILTAHDSIDDRIKGLDVGADDYLCKPFDLSELCARIRALIRRAGGGTGRAIPTINVRNIMLDPATRRVYKDGAAVELSRREFVLLHLLLENVNRVMSREQIIQNLYGWGDDVDSNALEVHIHNIRKKLGNSFIATVRGVGYMIEDPEKMKEEK